ncbi:hypothetical protein IFM89_031168, partial [Coptis chinensis]
RGLSGGLWLLWDGDVDLNIVYVDAWIIHAKINEISSPCWYFSGIYGNNDFLTRKEQWQMMETLNPGNDHAWLCAGDFNDILYREEKRGGRPVYQWQCQPFADMIQNCELMDLEFVGSTFTWTNNQCFRTRVSKRLDRALCSSKWRETFESRTGETETEKDHLGLKLCGLEMLDARMWKELIEWNHKCFGNLDVKLKQLDRKLTECQEQQHRYVIPTEKQLIQEQSLLLEYEEVLKMKDTHWGQKARHD